MRDKISIAIYMRLSQEDGDLGAESGSIANQRHFLRSYVERHFENYDLLEFQDDGYTGANFCRPGVLELLEQARGGQVDCIVVKDLSRFSRDYIEVGAYLEQIFPFAGVRFIAVNDGYDSERQEGGAEGMALSFQNLVNDLYCKDVSVKVKSALKIKKENGIYANGSCPFGYRKDPGDRHKLLVVEEEAKVVRRVFQMTLDGLSSQTIAKRLNAEGVKTPMEHKIERGIGAMAPKGRRFEWSAPAICQMLRNGSYVGDFVYGKYETPEVSKKSRLKPRSEWKVFPNHHEAIIERSTFEAVQKSRGAKKARKHERHPLTGKLECGNCHQALKIRHTKKPYFFCGNQYVTRYEGCAGQVNAKFLERHLLFCLQAEAGRQADRLICQEAKQQAEQKLESLHRQRRQLKERLKAIQAEQARAYEEYARKARSREGYAKAQEELKEQAGQSRGLLEEIERRAKALEGMISKWGLDAELSMQDFSFPELTQDVVDQFVKKVVAHDEQNIEITWNAPEKLAAEVLQHQIAAL